MGDSKKGEGGGRRPTTADIATYLRHEFEKDKREVEALTVQLVTERTYAVTVRVVGENESEATFLTVE
jgi:hypothetical protein